ncbi:MAG TPA: peptidoglycan DD-metalloendopeptidase family protein [Nitrospiria bacterium]|nr:peptidoglycan DD-metalloendopeptidase family protein [Nitrospiria bacterium]
MKRVLIPTLCVLAVLAPVLFLTGVDGSAESPSDSVSKKVTQEKQELDRLRQKIDQQRRKSRDAAKRENSILANLEEVDYQRTLKKKELRVVNLQLIERDQEIEQLDGDLSALRREIESKQGRVRERLRVLYQEGRFNTLKVLFTSSDHYDFLRRYYYLTWISNKESDLLRSYQSAVERLEPKEAAERKARADLLEYKNEITQKLSEIHTEKRKKDLLLASIRDEKTTYERTLRELEDSAARLKGLIQELEKQRRARREPSPGEGFAFQRGHLDWPTLGRVVTLFGRQKHPRFDTYVFRKGIEIQSSQGSPIRSVYGGSVVFADWFRGYGLLVIIDHGKNYFTLYAHAAKLLVSPGDTVSQRQVIGEIGDTGLTSDNNLYFEIRHGADPVDPLTWLKRR